MNGTLVVGLGSPHGDDCVGWLVADRLQADVAASLAVRRADIPLDIVDWLEGLDRLVICDACQASGRPGRLRRWQWPTAKLPSGQRRGSHDLDLPSVLRLAESLGSLPPCVVVWGVEIHDYRPCRRLTPEVAAAVPRAVAAVRRELKLPAPPAADFNQGDGNNASHKTSGH